MKSKLERLLTQATQMRIPVPEAEIGTLTRLGNMCLVMDEQRKFFFTVSPRDTDVIIARQMWKFFVDVTETE